MALTKCQITYLIIRYFEIIFRKLINKSSSFCFDTSFRYCCLVEIKITLTNGRVKQKWLHFLFVYLAEWGNLQVNKQKKVTLQLLLVAKMRQIIE